MSTPNAHLSIDYDEGKPGTYRAVEVTGPRELVKRFETGDVEADWRSAILYAAGHLEDGTAAFIITSSSCDHFCMDDDNYGWNEDSMIVRRADNDD